MVDLKDCDECVTERVCVMKHAADQRALDLIVARFNTKIEAMEQALTLRSAEMERRLEALNELREDVVKDRQMYLKTNVYDVKIGSIEKTVHDLNRKVIVLETRSVVWTAATVGLFALVQFLLYWWKFNK